MSCILSELWWTVRSLCGRTFWLVWVLLCGALLSFAYAEPPAVAPQSNQDDKRLEADILLGAARNAVLRGDLGTALQRFREFQKRYPDREDGRRDYAGALFQAGRVQEALPEYERLLKLHPDDPQLLRTLVDAMLTLGDHPRAKNLLSAAVVQFPDRVDFAISLALLRALDGETSEAEDLIHNSIANRQLTDRRTRLDAASLYVQLRHPAEACPIIERLLTTDPNDARVLALSIRYALMIGDNQAALRQADRLDRLYPGNVDLRLELASALYAAGDYAEAGRLFADVLRQSPTNSVALIGCARVAMRDYRTNAAAAFLDTVPDNLRGRQWCLAVVERDTITGDYLNAHRILARLLQENPEDRQASMALADLDRAENEFVKADSRYLADGATKDNSVAARHFALSLYLQRRFGDAERVCRNLLVSDPADVEATVVLVRVLMKTNRQAEAAELQTRSGRTIAALPEYAYFAQVASEKFPPRYASQPRPIYTAVTLFDLAMEDGQRAWAKQVLDEALQVEPNNIVLKTRLAEWYASFGVPGQTSCAARIYEELLAQEPSNQKWMLGLARAKATMRCNDEALALYRKLRCQSPDNYLYARETARVVFCVCGSPQGLAEYDSALCNWSGLDEEACRLAKERLAKATSCSSPSIAIGAYENLLTVEPYEQHLAFELGQARGYLGNTTDAMGAYSCLLDVNPNHRDAQVAIEGKQLEQCPLLMADTRFVRERGRDGLTSIDRFGEYVSYQFARGDENEHLSIGYGRLSLAPTFGQGTTGNAVTFRCEKQVHADLGPLLSPYAPLALFVDGELQQYDRFVATRPVFEAGIKFHTFDDLVWTISGTMDNVLENGESLQQDIYRGGLRTDLCYKPCNYWEAEATYAWQSYSDDNTRNAAEFRNRLQLTPDPRRLSLLADCYYWNFAQASVFSPGPDPFNNMQHPYWTPQNYVMGGVGVEWKQWLSWDRFDGSQHCWVAFSAMKRWDNQAQNYIVYRGTLGWDITRHLKGYAMGEYDEGAPYRGTWAYGGLAWRL
jgi:predicted Zn-dependent protease